MITRRRFMRAAPIRAARNSAAHEAACQARKSRNGEGPLEPLVIEAHAAAVFSQANVDQLGHVNVIADRLGPRDREIIILYAATQIAGGTDALPDEKRPHRQDLEFKEGPAPQRHSAPMPRGPVDEEQNVPGFFLDDGLKGVDQFFRKKSRSLGGLE